MFPASIPFPRGVVMGSCFAVLLAAPLFFAISLDSAAPFSSHFRFGNYRNAWSRPIFSSAEFFNRQVAVQVSVGSRPSTSSTPTTPRTESFFGPANTTDNHAKAKRMFQLRVENRSNKELSIEVLAAKSEFGDLSAGLQTIRLAPGQMTLTGVALNASAVTTKPLPVEVTLRLDDTNEKRQLVLAPATQP